MRAAVTAPGKHRQALWLKGHDSGSVTAEFAVILPAVVAVAALLLALTKTVCVSMDCQEAARVAARELVINHGQADLSALVHKLAGPQAQASHSQSGQELRVQVSCPVVSGPFAVLPARVQGSAVAMLDE